MRRWPELIGLALLASPAAAAGSGGTLEFSGRDNVIVILGVEDKPSCLIMTKTTVPARRVENLLTAAYGREPISRAGGNILWILDGKQDVLFTAVPEGEHQLV